LNEKRKVRSPRDPKWRPRLVHRGAGTAARAAAGAMRMGNAIGAAFSNRRTMEPVEARLMVQAGILLLLFSTLFAFYPRLLAYPVVVFFGWFALALLYRGYKIRRRK
jgi:cardiolipin synthase